MSDRPFVTLRNTRPDTALGKQNRCVAVWARRNWHWIPLLVDLDWCVANMLFVRCESELPYIRTLCNVLKQAGFGKLFENILRANAIPCP